MTTRAERPDIVLMHGRLGSSPGEQVVEAARRAAGLDVLATLAATDRFGRRLVVTDDPALVEPVCQASLIRYSPEVVLFSNPADAKGRHHLTVRASTDQGQTWPRSRLICEGSSAYSSLAVLPSGEIGLLYERDNYKHLTFARFPLDSIQATANAK